MDIIKNIIPEVKLSELLISRLCHELAGAIGAIDNGVEYVEENSSQLIEADVLSLLGASSKQLTSRLKFYRAAYGLACQKLDCITEIRILAVSLFESEDGIDLNWPMSPEIPIFKGNEGRFLLNLLIVAKQCLPYGGCVDVDFYNEKYVVSATGKDAKLQDSYIKLSTGNMDVSLLTAREIHDYYTLQLAASVSKGIEVQTNDEAGFVEFTINDL